MGVGAIWAAVALTSVFAPDMVTGSEQQHLPIAAMTAWFWGSLATAAILVPVLLNRQRLGIRHGTWSVLGAGTAAIWTAVTVAAVFVPPMVTGSDPTSIPLAAMVAPVAGAFSTGFLAAFVAVLMTGRRA